MTISEEDQKWINENMEEYKPMEVKYELELYLSTDGKNTVHLKVEGGKEERQKAAADAIRFFDFIKGRYGTKADLWDGKINGKGAKTEKSPEMKCPDCGGEMWDNRPKKKSGEFSAKSPDFKCRNKDCGKVIWPKKKE